MRHLRLAADYFASPVWDVDAGVMVELSTLQIDAALAAALRAWADWFDTTLNPDDPVESSFASPVETAAFVEEGRQLARELQRQLGPEFDVRYGSDA